MGRSKVVSRFVVTFLVAAAIVIVDAGCQFHEGTYSLHGNGGAGGGGLADAGTVTGVAGQAGTMGKVPTLTFDASTTDSNGMSNPDMNCAAVNQGATPQPPDILILLDRSGSMDWNADASCMRNCGANSRWNQVTAALNQVVPMTDTTVNWGLKFFGSGNSCAGNKGSRIII